MPETNPREISATDPDWAREAPRGWWDPSRKLLRSIRRYQVARARQGIGARMARRWWALQHRFWSVITQAEISPTTRIGGGLLLPHRTDRDSSGAIMDQLPYSSSYHRDGPMAAPRIGGHVDIGAGFSVRSRSGIMPSSGPMPS